MTDKLELDISISKIDFFRKSVTLKIVVVGDTNCAIVLLKRILLIVFNCSNNLLFNIGEDIFNRKRIIDVFCQRLRLLNYNNYYTSYFFRRNAATEARNSNILKTIIILLDR